ncbi:hypothetical protein C1X35_21540 [Pseudomonas sp. FW306-1C-G01A]|nr:hypothetical protein C1X56_01985 [Pseudomonas sp. GW101-1A09]PMV90943.1 hypothetical protein C1X51_22710 [Pseudomonas sp. FW306-2-2C-B10A]PMW02981.1 hypothetical protein C1X55_00035 [Pseudomonas sp. GW460-C8]PMW03400.1 hypothetical protein C1X50_23035 [Pseudomonas sp. MPR-TSA4]PMW22452.1 hypothetical protein C1X52_01370 [Pseudomonas sp. FW306-2-1A-C05A]PMW24844.1 hypothetical protein C1X40_02655 [Pseudomonas sp. GW456-11-11-14-TSB2]PMW26401.1 hypothetical protein C1X53_04670 [Pseudomonas s
MVGGLHRVEVFWECWVIRVKKMLRPGGLGIFFGVCECSTLPLFCIWGAATAVAGKGICEKTGFLHK